MIHFALCGSPKHWYLCSSVGWEYNLQWEAIRLCLVTGLWKPKELIIGRYKSWFRYCSSIWLLHFHLRSIISRASDTCFQISSVIMHQFN
jgi:hypothetical protein